MFKLFIVDLIKSGRELSEDGNVLKNVLPPKRLRNRRIYDRFDIDHKHLALMNEQDILVVRDISEKGFSTEVSERSYQRFAVGDVHKCRIRYLNEIYEAETCVRWKAKNFVGFEVVKASRKMYQFLKRLLKPLEIGSSLHKVEEKYIESRDKEGMIWYSGVKNTNCFLWPDEGGAIKSWKLESDKHFIEWNSYGKIKTGTINISPVSSASQSSSLLQPWAKQEFIEDEEIDSEFKQFATDILMAAQIPHKEQIIESIVE